jgi:hypothetical protein
LFGECGDACNSNYRCGVEITNEKGILVAGVRNSRVWGIFWTLEGDAAILEGGFDGSDLRIEVKYWQKRMPFWSRYGK